MVPREPRAGIKWFNSEKGFGFIAQDGGGPDVFAHYFNIASNGYRELVFSELPLQARPEAS
ncbi:cold shock domain-containing protein [Streptomyces sp. PanSC9]|uniref:cold shock domain-containing protein n=1 Tax=Streptomyces sp. PanSC9 TaxID=1520461 RepID=UPI00288B29DC|nr:cold shock domain-containing protein [Streptomyces sp. PanSC9]